MDTLQIIREDPERRGEYYKEFVLNGGLRMAAVYADAVHYQKDGQWEPIDNTLKLSGGAYVNTTGVWQVSLPQQFGSSYTYDEEGNVTSVTDLQGQITDYEYDDINNTDLLRIIQDNKAKVTYTYDPYHNVKTATTQEGVTYEFVYDVYGNNTAVSIKFGEISITSTADYTDDGNRLETTTDALGNETHYSYHPDTNLLQWVKAPEDTEASRTEYTYDTMYHLASVTANVETITNTPSILATCNYTYTDDQLTKLKTPFTTYYFSYGDFGLRSKINIGPWTLAEYSYTDKNHYLQRVDYGNGDMVEYSYDNNGNLIAQLYEDGDTVTYKYDNSGELASVTDSASGLTTKYYYDLTGRLMKYTETGTDFSHSAAYTYDKLNNLTKLQETIGSTIRDTTYTYDDDNRVIGTSVSNAYRSFTYDEYGRLENRTTKYRATDLITESFGFSGNGTAGTSGQVSSHSFSYGSTQFSYGYSYDKNGNITSILKNGVTICQYVYDSQNQLVRENNLEANKTSVWLYDHAGNIISRTEYPYTTGELGTQTDVVRYQHYDAYWGDLLFNYDGNLITHDDLGNPLDDGTWTYTWEHGRELTAMAKKDQSEQWDFTYNADGLRTKRTNGDRTYEYTYLGSQLTRMTVDGHDLYFTYDAAGTPLTVSCDGTLYYYITNIQGDVIAIIDTAGTQVTSYIYDAWGNIISHTGSTSTIGRYNPLTYRGYVYDTETGLYYLQSRYYNPKVGRFINADGYVATGQGFTGNNMFAYCLNNPVNFVDRNGENPEPLAAWLSGMWWLCGVDGVLPIGEVVYVGAAVIIGVATIGIVDDAFAVGEELSNHLMQYAEHTSGVRKSTKNKHEKGKKRKQNDQGGEGGDQRRINYRKNKRKASYYPKRKARRGVNNAPLLTIPNASGGIRMIGIGQGFRP